MLPKEKEDRGEQPGIGVCGALLSYNDLSEGQIFIACAFEYVLMPDKVYRHVCTVNFGTSGDLLSEFRMLKDYLTFEIWGH